MTPDPHYDDPRLVAVYDPLDPDRSDLEFYAGLVAEFDAWSVIDLGCGTGTFACMLAGVGLPYVTGVDPAAASLEVARRKAFGDRVRWIHGDAAALPANDADLVTMTGNAAQTLLSEEAWDAALPRIRDALRIGGRFVFETRDPERRAWLEWDRESTHARADVPGVGAVESWVEVTDVDLPLVSFRGTYVFAADGAVLTSDSTLRFPGRDEMTETLRRNGFAVDAVRDAPDRPGRELVFVTRWTGDDAELWSAVVAAEREVRLARARFHQLARDRVEVLRKALGEPDWDRSAALELLTSLAADVPALAPELTELSLSMRMTAHEWDLLRALLDPIRDADDPDLGENSGDEA